jgi:hypothetical protein
MVLAGLRAAMLGLNSWDKRAIKNGTHKGPMTNESRTEMESAM